MKIHEYQAKEILKKYNIPIQNGVVLDSLENIKNIEIKFPCVVKAQIHAGGRGKGGGVKLAKNFEEFKKYSTQILGMNLITHQTGPEGKIVKKILITEALDIKKEYYLGIVFDRERSSYTIIASPQGGMEIEKVAEETPELIFKENINSSTGFSAFQGRKLGFKLKFNTKQISVFTNIINSLYQIAIEKDANLIEVNPLITTDKDELIAVDCKMTFDDNALFKHKDISAYRDLNEEDEKESIAKNFDLSYIALDGNIGCMVNGAGLAMATMDIIKYFGGEPANFLDVGGGATKEKVTQAFKIILSDKSVKGIFVNIFGGIMKCDVIANGIIDAVKEVSMTIPLVVRLEGTNVELGKELLKNSGLNIVSADDMEDGAKKIVSLTGGK